MGLENPVNRISDLNAAWPVGATDLRSQGDDHLRIVKTALRTLLTMLGEAAISSLTVAGGAVTPTQAFHSIATGGGAANLDTLTNTNIYDGRLVLIRCASGANPITVRDNSVGGGNIFLRGGASFLMDDVQKYLLLARDGTSFCELARIPQTEAEYVDWKVGSAPAAPQSTSFARIFTPATGEFLAELSTGNFRRLPDDQETYSDADQTLTYSSKRHAFITPTLNRTITLPTTTIAAGWKVEIENLAAPGIYCIVKASGGTAICLIDGGESVEFTARADTPTTPAGWRVRSSIGGNTGDVKFNSSPISISGHLVCDGSAVSRTTYAKLFAAISISTTGTTHGNTLIDSIPSTAAMDVGMPISGTNIPAGTTISSVDSATQIHISQDATGSAVGQAIVVAPNGVGDGSTTFNVPDLRGRAVVGVGTGSSLTHRALGVKGGEETHLLTGAESGTGSHVHQESYTRDGRTVLPATIFSGAFIYNNINAETIVNTQLVGSNDAPQQESGHPLNTQAAAAAGASSAHNNMQPFVGMNAFIRI